MRRFLDTVAVLLGLLALGALAVVLTLIFGGAWGGDAAFTPQAMQSPLPSPTPRAYPPPGTAARQPEDTVLPQVTPAPTQPPYPPPATPGPPGTRPPKPTPAPTPIPTATPIPTPLPLPPSAFYALWTENLAPEGYGGVVWLADPRDIGRRREVLRTKQENVVQAVLSPDARRIALVLTYSKNTTLWVANIDGSDLRQLAMVDYPGPLARDYPLWTRDSQALVYLKDRPVSATEYHREFRIVDVSSGADSLLVADAVERLSAWPLGWSADGRWLYYPRSRIGEGGELWAVDQQGAKPHMVAFLGRVPMPLLSPSGDKLLFASPQEVSWSSLDGREKQSIPASWLGRGSQVLWAPESKEVILGQIDEKQPLYHLKSIDISTQSVHELATFGIPGPGGWQLLALSSDRQWLAASLYQTGLHWIHFPTGTIIPVPGPWATFAAWVPREVAGW